MKKRLTRGFTLIELMITVAIIGILTMVAYPSYTNFLVRGNRTAAQAQMMDLANRQQQFLLGNRRYATSLSELNYTLPTEVSSKYSCGSGCIVTNTTATPATTVPAFTITFTATGSQASDGNLSLNSEGTKTPSGKW
jgi:type IV pilus assembly protein PilE